MHKKFLSVASLLVLFFALPFLVLVAQQAQQWFTRATGSNATIVVDTTKTLDPISPFWKAFSQGGEEPTNMIGPAVNQLATLDPRYIRIDHIYDFFNIVQGSPGNLSFDFSRLDPMIDSILATGAKPLIALSYMPAAIAQDGTIINAPVNWNDWALTVQKTVEHYSGRSNKNIAGVYYEVWNEPDLFGGWKVYGDKNYMTLYSYAVTGANRAANVQPFAIGGPATTALYKNWMTALLKQTANNKLRLDFISWHRYNLSPEQFSKDLSEATKWTFDYPAFVTLPKLITEWGFDPEINGGYDGNFAAAHAVAVVREVLFGYQNLFAFEPVDGLDPAGNEYWGRWGLMTHPSKGLKIKPRYTAFTLLNRMTGSQVQVTGEGSWVTGFATKVGSSIKLILSNYDPAGTHTETVPITFTGLTNGTYRYQQTLLPGNSTTLTETVTNGSLQKSVFMPRSSVLFVELTPQ